MDCQEGRKAVSELPGLSRVLGYISAQADGRFRAENLLGEPMRDESFDSVNEAAIFIDELSLN